MEDGKIQVYYGTGIGKSSAALGHAIRAASAGESVCIIQFMKGQLASDYWKRLEPEVKEFRFEHSAGSFEELTPEEKEKEVQNIKNGLMYAKKVLTTGGCDLLVLDEALGLIHAGVATEEEVLEVLAAKSPLTKIILTGTNLTQKIADAADQIFNIVPEK